MAIKATSQVTIMDLKDGRALSAYLTSNLPKTQILDTNDNTYSPSWENTHLTITPVIMMGQDNIPLGSTGLTIQWKRKIGAGVETELVSGESVAGGILTVNKNVLSPAENSAGLITYIAFISYVDPDTEAVLSITNDITFSLVTTGINAHLAWINGEQVFRYNSDGVVTPSSITLTATTQGVSFTKWQHKNASGAWVDSGVSQTSISISPTHPAFNGKDIAVFRIITSDPNVTDEFTLFKVRDGATGISATTVYLTNESVTLPANVSGAVPAGTSFIVDVGAFLGASAISPTVTTPTSTHGLPTGMTVTKSTVGNMQRLTFNVNSASSLGGADRGEINIPVVANGIDFTKKLTWAKSKTGATGAKGDKGDSAVTFTVYAPNGEVFINQSGTLLLATQAYEGANAISSGATYQWQKFTSGTWQNISGATSSTYEVQGSSVHGAGSFKCVMTYKGSTYQDVITLVDKTDSYSAVCIALAGTTFINAVGETPIICRLFQNGIEVDNDGEPPIGTVAPTNPSSGALWWKVDRTNKTVTLQRYNGTSWVNAPSQYQPQYTYTWYRMDRDGNPSEPTPFKTGKVIFVDGDDVDVKHTFICEVS